MKVDNFVLLMISIITLIIISLVTECNRGRLMELENKATKEIVETFFNNGGGGGNVGSAAIPGSGQLGYKITEITDGQYGGRSSQQVINDIGSHSENDYITDDQYSSYGSNLFQKKS